MRSEELYLSDIISAIGSIAKFIDGVSLERFQQDELIQSGVLLKLLTIGEAARHLSEDFRDSHSDIAWSDIIGFRNFAIHAYFSINWDIVWMTAKQKAPVLGQQVWKILRDEFPETFQMFYKD